MIIYNKEEWELQKKILDAKLKSCKKNLNFCKFTFRKDKQQTLHNLAEEEFKLKIKLMKCELIIKLEKSL